MPHFTYKSNTEMDRLNLCQGDVVRITDQLKCVLDEVHPYFVNDQYKYFIIITQSCDLVLRDGKCKSNYITIAPVRTFNDYIYKAGQKIGAKKYGEYLIVSDDKSNELEQLVERLYNNNESEYFFLSKDETLNFDEDMVAYLKVSIALKSELHYDKCLEAKFIELSDEFKAKLGWLTGQMYSKVGTKDWLTVYASRRDFLLEIRSVLKKSFLFCEKKKYNTLMDKLNLEANIDLTIIERAIESINIKSKYDETVEVIYKIIDSSNEFKSIESKELFKARVQSNSMLRSKLN